MDKRGRKRRGTHERRGEKTAYNRKGLRGPGVGRTLLVCFASQVHVTDPARKSNSSPESEISENACKVRAVQKESSSRTEGNPGRSSIASQCMHSQFRERWVAAVTIMSACDSRPRKNGKAGKDTRRASRRKTDFRNHGQGSAERSRPEKRTRP